MTEQTMTTAVTPTEWEAWRNLRSMWRQLDRALESQLQQTAGISTADYGVLGMLFEAPDKQLRANELGAGLAWEKSRVSHQVSRMEKRGLVERRECDVDARGTWVAITPAGSRAMLSATRDHATSLRKYVFDALTADELAQLQRASSKVLDVLQPEICEQLDS